MDSPNPSPRKKTPQNAGEVAKKAIEQAMQSAEAEPQKKKMGRPLKYDPDIADRICEQLADGIPLREICRQDGYPAWQTIYYWMTADDALGEKGRGLSKAIAHAREIGQDAIAEDIFREMCMEPERILSEGGGRIDSGYVQLIKARAEIKLKLLAKWNPKRYGDKIAVGGDADNPFKAQVDVSLFDTLLTTLETRRQAKNG